MNDGPEHQLALKRVDSFLSTSTAQSSLVARGRRDAANLPLDPLSEALRLAEAGDTHVQWCLGRAYLFGNGKQPRFLWEQTNLIVAPQDNAEAIRWFRKAAEAGHAESAVSLSYCYFEMGEYAEAVRWLRKCVPSEFGIAELYLAKCYFAGAGVQRDRSEAVQWLLEALHREVDEDTADDIGSLLSWISACDWVSMFDLDTPAAQPVIVKQWHLDTDELADDFEDDRKYADKGNSHFQFCLGLAYAFGRGVAQDYVEAAKWFRQVANAGEADAQVQLGLAYACGRGVPQDYVQAYFWCDLAASGSKGKHQETLIRIRDTVAIVMKPEQIAEAQELALEQKAKLPKR